MIYVGAWGGLALLILILLPFFKEFFITLLEVIFFPFALLSQGCSFISKKMHLSRFRRRLRSNEYYSQMSSFMTKVMPKITMAIVVISMLTIVAIAYYYFWVVL